MRDPELDQIAATLREIRFPSRFAVEVSAECNLACTMCHHPSMRRPKGRMPFALWKKCADEIAALSPRTHCWLSFCGEPLLEPDLTMRMLEYGGEVGLDSLNLNTNGMPLSREVADRLVESPVRLIVVGIDGFSEAVYEGIRVGGDRDVLYANVEYLLEASRRAPDGPEVQVQFIEMEENEEELEEFSEFWLERGATLKVRNKLSWGGRFDTALDVAADERIPCPWAMTMMHVFWDGRVPRCPADTEGDEGVGNAWDEPLVVLWKRLGEYRRLHMEHRFDELPDRCHDCKDWMTGAAERIRPRSIAASAPTAGRRGAGRSV